jgi:hypothetical protein
MGAYQQHQGSDHEGVLSVVSLFFFFFIMYFDTLLFSLSYFHGFLNHYGLFYLCLPFVLLRQKRGVILIFGISRFCPLMAKGRVCWFIFIGYILVDKNASISGTAITGTPYF